VAFIHKKLRNALSMKITVDLHLKIIGRWLRLISLVNVIFEQMLLYSSHLRLAGCCSFINKSLTVGEWL